MPKRSRRIILRPTTTSIQVQHPGQRPRVQHVRRGIIHERVNCNDDRKMGKKGFVAKIKKPLLEG
jgi:hypothetical protein